MLDKNFMRLAAPINGFGTENVGPLLYAQVSFCRPRSLLEVGAGYTTLFMLQALKDTKEQDQAARRSGIFVNGRTEFFERPYEPILTTLDDFSHGDSVARSVQGLASLLGLDQAVDFQNRDFRGFSRHLPAARLPLDFVWFDCGGLDEHIDFVKEYWHLVNPDGGTILFHSTQTNFTLRLFEKQLQSLHVRDAGRSFELLSLIEPHKRTQNSVTQVRMTGALKRRLYTFLP